jgi:hypothetical protein
MGSQLGHRRNQRGLLGIIDDDEEIDSNWFDCCFSAFAEAKHTYGARRFPEMHPCEHDGTRIPSESGPCS